MSDINKVSDINDNFGKKEALEFYSNKKNNNPSTTLSGVDVGLQVGKNSEGITASAAKYKDTTFAVFTLGYSF